MEDFSKLQNYIIQTLSTKPRIKRVVIDSENLQSIAAEEGVSKQMISASVLGFCDRIISFLEDLNPKSFSQIKNDEITYAAIVFAVKKAVRKMGYSGFSSGNALKDLLMEEGVPLPYKNYLKTSKIKRKWTEKFSNAFLIAHDCLFNNTSIIDCEKFQISEKVIALINGRGGIASLQDVTALFKEHYNHYTDPQTLNRYIASKTSRLNTELFACGLGQYMTIHRLAREFTDKEQEAIEKAAKEFARKSGGVIDIEQFVAQTALFKERVEYDTKRLARSILLKKQTFKAIGRDKIEYLEAGTKT